MFRTLRSYRAPLNHALASATLALALLALLGCGSSEAEEAAPIAPGTPSSEVPGSVTPSAPSTTAAALNITEVLFATALDEEWQPVGGAQTVFPADQETIWTRVTVAGRPRTGIVTMRWMWRDLRMGEFPVDLSSVNGGVFFSFGQNTYLQGYVTPQSFYVGTGHRLVLMSGGVELGSYGFTVVPPVNARPSRFVSATLHNADPRQGDPGPPRTTFAAGEHVHVVGRVALGRRSWFNCTVAINGEPMPAMTREIMGPDDGGDELNFALDMFPEGGWPPGQHHITLVLNDNEVAAYDITVPPGLL